MPENFTIRQAARRCAVTNGAQHLPGAHRAAFGRNSKIAVTLVENASFTDVEWLRGRMAAPQPLEAGVTLTAEPRQTAGALDGDLRVQSTCGGQTFPHDFRTEQAGVVLSRVVCMMCGTVRIEQAVDRTAAVSWSRTDYEIADRFYRELVS